MTLPTVQWTESGQSRTASWRSSSGHTPPRRIELADDSLTADRAFRLASEGTALLWRGDFQNARQLLQALGRRIDRRPRKPPQDPAQVFNLHRQAQAQRSRTLGMLLVELQADYGIDLRRAPDWRQACSEAYGHGNGQPLLVSLRELLGVVGAHEWRKKGVRIAALDAAIHPHYGVFSPVRGEYVDMVARAPLPASIDTAFDVGTGTGVLAAVLARRGVPRVVATDQDERALACARDNVDRLGLAARIDVVRADLFPPGRAQLIVCNPPWLPARAVSTLEHAVYDPDSRMLLGFLGGLRDHLTPSGEAWLVLSDLAEHLGLRSREQLLAAFDQAGVRVAGRIDARPTHHKAADTEDPLHAARAAEVTSLWRLALEERTS